MCYESGQVDHTSIHVHGGKGGLIFTFLLFFYFLPPPGKKKTCTCMHSSHLTGFLSHSHVRNQGRRFWPWIVSISNWLSILFIQFRAFWTWQSVTQCYHSHWMLEKERYMGHQWSTRPVVITRIWFCFPAILKSRDGRTDMCENSDHYWQWLWVGGVDQ